MHPLSGIRILDLSRVLAGPWCTQTLADLGADVVKLEKPGSGDDTRAWGPPFFSPPGSEVPLTDSSTDNRPMSAYFASTNRNKRSIACDISTAEGQALVRKLAAHSTVLVENFKVGDLARYGLDWVALQALNPRLVVCSITGFGQTGPYAQQAGYDFAVQAMGGLMSITGAAGDLPGSGPQKAGVAIADIATGLYAAIAILAAVRHAEATGQGQHIDLALLDTQVALLANVGAGYLASGVVPPRMGNAHASIVPYQAFEVAVSLQPADLQPAGSQQPVERDFIIVAVGNDAQFGKFCSAAHIPELAINPLFARNADRVRNRSMLVPVLEVVLRTRTKADWLTALQAAGVPCGPINTIAEVFADPQVQVRQMVIPSAGTTQPLTASPIRLSATPVRRCDMPPPQLGQHTDDILREWLGMDDSAIAELRAGGSLG